MPELGKYAGAVIGSYAASIVLLVVLILLTIWQSRRVRRNLNVVEARQGKSE